MELFNTLIPSGLRLIILVVIAMVAIFNVAQTATVPSNPAPRAAADETVANNDIDLLTYNASHLLQEHFGFCISNSERDGDQVFGYTKSNITFLIDCDDMLGGSLADRLCVMSEMRLYFANLATVDTPPPNINCNATSWEQAYEAGWAGRVSTSVNLDSEIVPSRILDPLPCCEGFFCPRGLSCMIPCPMGSYCPMATLDHSTNICEPYGYQVTQNSSLYSCGGADKWADVTSTHIFCPAGKYCPTPVEARNCSTGHYCRLGSTNQEKCSHLTSCDTENLPSQNLQGVGGLILAALLIILLAVYTCSDWLMDLRRRRKTYAREMAAKQAHERISKFERLKKVKSTAKRQALKFTRKLSRTMSRKNTEPQSDEELQILSQSPEGAMINLQILSPEGAMNSSQMQEPGATLRSEHSGLISEIIHENKPATSAKPPLPLPRLLVNLSAKFQEAINQDSPTPAHEMSAALNTDSAPSTVPVNADPKMSDKLPRLLIPTRESHSQMFAYAYGQLEKERAFGFKGESPSLTGLQQIEQPDGMVVEKKRFQIEVSFVELSLVLKGSGKKILSNVTGTFLPGRITAIMGPSGAGKTTFLNALAGKSTNSHPTGQVIINGKPGSMHCYKRVIGFVPQDDIVHGSLTVEENLWFSASYRLPVKMPRYERVLVVERTIQALGLGSIRDSIVGTVEKRGISGGQRKRVNVGLELVIEPSLLILDEPTSGLDSTSSRLVLQALRRETMVGVNVSLVLHQPSYGLFKMFDDVMFLAKGGYTVYLGPVNEVEPYFEGLGLVVPERINPPDYYMDALEGAVQQGVTGPNNIDPKSLPVLWMMHKGYKIPKELLKVAAAIETPAAKKKILEAESSRFMSTFAQEAWQEIYQKVVVSWDEIKTSLLKVHDLSGRQTPGFFVQLTIILHRLAKQRFREARILVQDYIILLIAGACLGVLSNMKDTNLGSQGYHFTIIALALLSMISSLRTFSADKLQYWRESASGINRVAFFISKDVADLFNVFLKPLIYLSMFYFFSNPRSTFVSNYVVTLMLVYCVTGIAYIVAILLEPAPAQLCAVFLPVIATLIITSKRTGFLQGLTYLSYARYALEAYVLANAERYKGVWIITRCGLLANQGYHLDDWGGCLLILLGHGLGARLVALLCLLFSNRSRQK